VNIDPASARVGDKIIINGPIAQHGIAIMSVREGLEFETQLASDTAPLNGLVETILAISKDIHVLRDPTRGGVTSALTKSPNHPSLASGSMNTRFPSAKRSKEPARFLGSIR